jgi:hypothetical protein
LSKDLRDYCVRHRISLEWMLTGNLKNLKETIDARRDRATAASPSSLTEKLARLSESERELVLKTVEGMLPEHRQ